MWPYIQKDVVERYHILGTSLSLSVKSKDYFKSIRRFLSISFNINECITDVFLLLNRELLMLHTKNQIIIIIWKYQFLQECLDSFVF